MKFRNGNDIYDKTKIISKALYATYESKKIKIKDLDNKLLTDLLQNIIDDLIKNPQY